MRNHFRLPVLALVTAGALASLAPAASAAGSGYVTMWEDRNYRGEQYIDYRQGSARADQVEIHWWDGDNEITALKNNTSKWVVLYANDGFTGRMRCLAPGQEIANLGWYGFDNQAESFELRDTNVCL